MTGLDAGIRAYYDKGEEQGRLSGASLERVRTQELISRFLPNRVLKAIDIGGGAGVHAGWLSSLGHDVTLVDPIPLHVEQVRAAHKGVKAEVGDARSLAFEDDSFDVALLLGPLYHLPQRDERMRALGEARRVLRASGLLFAAAISRFAALMDLLINIDRLHEDDVWELVKTSVATGEFRGPGEAGLFTTGYFHLPDELKSEVSESGFEKVEVFNIEGPGNFVSDVEARWEDEDRREAMLKAARLVEKEPTMMGASSHLLAVGNQTS